MVSFLEKRSLATAYEGLSWHEYKGNKGPREKSARYSSSERRKRSKGVCLKEPEPKDVKLRRSHLWKIRAGTTKPEETKLTPIIETLPG